MFPRNIFTGKKPFDALPEHHRCQRRIDKTQCYDLQYGNNDEPHQYLADDLYPTPYGRRRRFFLRKSVIHSNAAPKTHSAR